LCPDMQAGRSSVAPYGDRGIADDGLAGAVVAGARVSDEGEEDLVEGGWRSGAMAWMVVNLVAVQTVRFDIKARRTGNDRHR
jgi:hypothetical protein